MPRYRVVMAVGKRDHTWLEFGLEIEVSAPPGREEPTAEKVLRLAMSEVEAILNGRNESATFVTMLHYERIGEE